MSTAVQPNQEVLTEFTQTLEDLLDELYRVLLDLELKGYKDSSVVSASNKLILVKTLLSSTAMTTILGHFRQHLLPHEERIAKREDRFFLESQNLFPVPEEHITFIKELWTGKAGFSFCSQQKEMIALYMMHLITLIKRYDNS